MVTVAVPDTMQLLGAYRESRDRSARDTLVARYEPLVRKLCRKYRLSGEPQEDLFQVGVIGLLAAIEKFDPHHGTHFVTLAIPYVVGAVRNYLRDKGNLLKLPRTLRRNMLMVRQVRDRLAPGLGRWPTALELARECQMPVEDIRASLGLAEEFNPCSLDRRLEANDAGECTTMADFLGREDDGFARSLDRMSLETAMEALGKRERTVIALRYYRGLTQAQTASRLDISQMHVSRLQRRALTKLKFALQGRDDSRIGRAKQPDVPCAT